MHEIPLPAPPLDDGVVVLRPWLEADVEDVTAACQDPEIPRWTAIPSPYTQRDARDYIRRAERDRRAGRELTLAVVDAGDGRLLGSCGLTRVDWQDRKGEIGYWIAAEARNRAVGTRSTVLVARWAIEQLGLERVELLANPANEASQRLALRAGFSREGLMRSYRRRKTGREDLVMFALLPEDLARG